MRPAPSVPTPARLGVPGEGEVTHLVVVVGRAQASKCFKMGRKWGKYSIEVGGERWDLEQLEEEGVCLVGNR